MCVIVSNFVPISQIVAEIWPFSIFQNVSLTLSCKLASFYHLWHIHMNHFCSSWLEAKVWTIKGEPAYWEIPIKMLWVCVCLWNKPTNRKSPTEKRRNPNKMANYFFFLVMMSRSLKRKKCSVRLHFLRSPDDGLHSWVTGPFFTRLRDSETSGTFWTTAQQHQATFIQARLKFANDNTKSCFRLTCHLDHFLGSIGRTIAQTRSIVTDKMVRVLATLMYCVCINGWTDRDAVWGAMYEVEIKIRLSVCRRKRWQVLRCSFFTKLIYRMTQKIQHASDIWTVNVLNILSEQRYIRHNKD